MFNIKATCILLWQPPYNFFRQFSGILVGNLWGWVYQLAIPQEKVCGIDLSFLEYLVPAVIALGCMQVCELYQQIIIMVHTMQEYMLLGMLEEFKGPINGHFLVPHLIIF